MLLLHEEVLYITREQCLQYNLSDCLFHISDTALLYKFFFPQFFIRDKLKFHQFRYERRSEKNISRCPKSNNLCPVYGLPLYGNKKS